MDADIITINPRKHGRPITDISNFENFAVPARPLTKEEWVTYRRLVGDWAKLNASAQSTLYANFLYGSLSRHVTDAFAETVQDAFNRLGRFSDPEAQAVMRAFTQASLQQDAQMHLGFKLTAARKMDGILAEPYEDAPAQQNFWHRFLGRQST